jgi:hypothetical protein
MPAAGKRWAVQDREGNTIYLTEERWQHIIDAENHPEMARHEQHLKSTLQVGRRRQEPLNPRKYRYTQSLDDLPDDFNHLVAIVLFGFDVSDSGDTVPNNFVVTAFLKHIQQKGGQK